MNVLLEPDVVFAPDESPKNELRSPMLNVPADAPNIALLFPTRFVAPAKAPKNEFRKPVVFA